MPLVLRGELPYEKVGDACQQSGIKPLKETNLGVAQAFLTPERYHLKWNRLPLSRKEAEMKTFFNKYYSFEGTL